MKDFVSSGSGKYPLAVRKAKPAEATLGCFLRLRFVDDVADAAVEDDNVEEDEITAEATAIAEGASLILTTGLVEPAVLAFPICVFVTYIRKQFLTKQKQESEVLEKYEGTELMIMRIG